MPIPKEFDDDSSGSEYNWSSPPADDSSDDSSDDVISDDDLAETDEDQGGVSQDDDELDDISDDGSVPDSPIKEPKQHGDVLTEDHISRLFHGNRKPPEFYRQKMEQFDAKDFQRRNLAARTENAIDRVLYEWRMFCRVVLQQPWKRSMKKIDLAMLQSFFEFHLYQERGKDGRKKRMTKITRSLQTFRNNFTLVYRREMHADPYHRLEKSAVTNLLEHCNTSFNLSSEKKDNRPMSLDDLKDQIETTLNTTEKMFKIGEQRILAVLFLLLLAPAGSRPDSILSIQLRDIQLALHRPKVGPVQLIIYLRLEKTKSYRGRKGVKTFIVPEVIYDPSLMLSPHVFLLAVLFHRRAFRVDWLNDDPSVLAKLTVKEDKQMPIPLKKELYDQYLFRGTKREAGGWVSSEKRMSGHAMHKSFVRIGKITGSEGNATAYTLRYMAGNNMNEEVNISTELQNLVMDHAPNSDTFQRSYLNRNITFDLWALQRGLQPQQDVVREAASFGYRKSARRPLDLTPGQLEALKEHAEYKFHKSRADKLKGTPHYDAARREMLAVFKRLRYAATKQLTGKEWTEQQAVDDIMEQISGGNHKPTAVQRRRQERPMSPAQQALMDALCQEMVTTLEGQLYRRTKAIEAAIAYCHIQEPLETKFTEHQEATATVLAKSVPGKAEPREAMVERFRRSVIVERQGQRLKFCYQCVAKAIKLPALDPNIDKLCISFSSPSALARHFRSCHLRFFDPDRLDPCPICIPKVKFKNMKQLRNHTELVHGIIDQPEKQPEKKPEKKKLSVPA